MFTDVLRISSQKDLLTSLQCAMNRKSTVWIGDLDTNTDEDFLIDAFRILGEPLCRVKIIRKNTESLCYGFLEFPDEESAQRVLHSYNGKLIPNALNGKRFKLNHATYSKDGTIQKDYSIFVGDLSPEVDDLALFDAFLARYKTVKLAKVIYDPSGISKGYGFVHFSSKTEYEASLVEMQNTHIGSKSVRVSPAQQKSRTSTPTVPGQDEQQWQQQYPGYDYQSYYAAWQNYQSQNPYYAYDQRYAAAYGSAYQYPQQYSYDPQQTTATAATTTSLAQYTQAAYEIPENIVEEHDIPLDIDQLNQELMQRNEEFYTALDDSRWLPTDNLDPPLLRMK
ncbi:tRNA selenocysteine 1-associated protein 1 [Caerostris darwini]|uniref:tRNA selenocysteine-associated protein 1 n=1 Tax=Caerostris darwini TaxID=1538125 RepID=A0AAV4UZZ0_9ARAC|nr:tRNA selenocysteine 1-associated protein 1 [Caerostris darwini]